MKKKKQYPPQKLLTQLFDYCSSGNLIWKVRLSGNTRIGKIAGVKGTKYKYVGIDGEIYCLHKLIFIFHFGVSPEIVDHINRDSDDTRIDNLRATDFRGSTLNRGMHKRNKSGLKGVVPNYGRVGFRAFIGNYNKLIYLGNFKTKEDAAKAYNKASLELHGEFGVQNVVS